MGEPTWGGWDYSVAAAVGVVLAVHHGRAGEEAGEEAAAAEGISVSSDGRGGSY